MKVNKCFFVVLTCFILLFLSTSREDSLAASCSPPVKIPGYAYNPTSIQDAYDYASNDLGLSNFTLLLAGQIFYENLILDGGAVMLDGGYDCAFTTKDSTTGIFGTITISTGSAKFEGGAGVVSTDRCDFDTDGDGFTRIGSCVGSADDCNDYDPAIHSGAVEICDGLDNNCDGQIDEGLTGTDADGDGYYGAGSCGGIVDDCNDNDASIHPGALDLPYDGVDQDCSGADLTFAGESCSDCHYPPGVSALHDLTTPPDATCATCHAATVTNILPGHYGDTVRTAGNNLSAGSTISCTACHDADSNTHSGAVTLGNGSNVMTNKVVAAWPNITCDTCHETRALLHATGTAHNNRIIDNSCGNCHTSDTSVLGSPGSGTLVSAADVDTLHRSDCALCHSYTGKLLDTGIVRQAIQQGLGGAQISCLDCHIDKGANHGNFTHPVEVGPNDLSYDAPGQPCSSCHVVANWTEIEGIEHNVPTNGAGSCATCHNSSRQEVIDTIALGANPTHCLDCHSDKQLTVHGTVDHLALGYVTAGTAYCLNCHDPGTAANATVEVTHLSNCALCHTSVPALQAGVPAGGGDCLTCHTSTWEATHTVNPPDHSTLVQVATTSCANCHDNTLVSAAANTHNACSSCHDTDGNLISLAIGQDFVTGGDCTTCHTGGWEATHTVNPPDHNTLVQVAATSCAGCHSDPPPLTDAADPKVHNACASCHDVNGALVSLAVGKSFGTGGDCTTCHTVAWDTIHGTHSHTVQVDSGDLSYDPPGTLCSECHVVSTWAEIEGIMHNVATNGAGSCATCHNSPRQEVIDAIALGANPTNCLDCHSGKLLTVHGSVDHVALGYVTGGATPCLTCHDPGAAANATVTGTHLNNCSLCHTTVPALQPGIPAGGGDCTTCHTTTWDETHTANTPSHNTLVQVSTTSCAGCHSDPPPLTDAADQKVHNACASCHDGDGRLISLAVGQNFTTGGDCASCHTSAWEATHITNTPDHSSLVQVATTDCAACHDNTLYSAAINTHNGCSSCHNVDGTLRSLAVGQTFAVGGDCTTCHGGTWSTTHTVAPDHSALVTVTGSSCGSCHSDPPPLTDAGDPKVHNACTSCHDATSGAPTSLAAGQTFAVGGNCATCHTDSWTLTHTTNTPSHNALVTVTGTGCADCHSDPPPLTDAADSKVHNACASCHDANGGLLSLAVGKTFAAGGNCVTCHTGSWAATHTTAPDHSGIVTVGTTGCAGCHDNTLVSAAANTHNACTSCHDANSGSLISLATGKSAPGDCTTCHTGTWESTHTTAPSHNSLVNVGTTDCADCHSDPPPLTDAADPKVHNACSTCHNAASGALMSLAVGKDFTTGGDCATCHGGNVQNVHTSCTTCHGEPPNGSIAPNTTGAHDAHGVLGFGSTSPSCAACHNGATHYSGTTEVGILSSFDDKDWGSPGFNGSTCSNLSCHGGQTTPSWSTGSLNVDTQCRSCHNDRTRGSDQYNDYYSGEHDVHARGADIACTECHSVSKLANGHFSNLQTTNFEQSPGTTIGGADTSIPEGSWNDSQNTCSINCHNEDHSGYSWLGNH